MSVKKGGNIAQERCGHFWPGSHCCLLCSAFFCDDGCHGRGEAKSVTGTEHVIVGGYKAVERG